MGVEEMSGIYIPGAKIPDGEYVRVLMLHKDGTCVDGIGNVFNVIPVPPHGRLIDADALPWFLANTSVKYATYEDWEMLCDAIVAAPTVIPASEEE